MRLTSCLRPPLWLPGEFPFFQLAALANMGPVDGPLLELDVSLGTGEGAAGSSRNGLGGWPGKKPNHSAQPRRCSVGRGLPRQTSHLITAAIPRAPCSMLTRTAARGDRMVSPYSIRACLVFGGVLMSATTGLTRGERTPRPLSRPAGVRRPPFWKTSVALLRRGASRPSTRWTPIIGRLDKVELRGWEAPHQEQDDGWEATCIRAGIRGEGGSCGRQG